MDLTNVSSDTATSWTISSVHFDEEVVVRSRSYDLCEASVLGSAFGRCLTTF